MIPPARIRAPIPHLCTLDSRSGSRVQLVALQGEATRTPTPRTQGKPPLARRRQPCNSQKKSSVSEIAKGRMCLGTPPPAGPFPRNQTNVRRCAVLLRVRVDESLLNLEVRGGPEHSAQLLDRNPSRTTVSYHFPRRVKSHCRTHESVVAHIRSRASL